MDKDLRKPNLLIGNYENKEDLSSRILKNEYICIDDIIPVCRFRGTFVECVANSKLKALVWQRNVARIRRMDVSLPTIVSIIINKDKVIEEITLDNSFKGSKGLFCSQKYLNKNLGAKIVGTKLDKEFLKKIKVENMHCFHMNEVLAGLYSYFNRIDDIEKIKKGDIFFDEEVTDSYVLNDCLIAAGKQHIKGIKPFYYNICMKDINKNVSFKKNGYLNVNNDIEVEFCINNKFVIKDIFHSTANDNVYNVLTKFAVNCLNEIKKYLGFDRKYKMLNTNLMPASFIGLVVQSLCVRMYQNSYNYTMHALTTIQRKNNIPMCIGAIRDIKEAEENFPGFDIKDIL